MSYNKSGCGDTQHPIPTFAGGRYLMRDRRHLNKISGTDTTDIVHRDDIRSCIEQTQPLLVNSDRHGGARDRGRRPETAIAGSVHEEPGRAKRRETSGCAQQLSTLLYDRIVRAICGS